MKFKNINIGFGICGSFCNHSLVKNIITDLKTEGANIIPIITKSVKTTDTRFGEAKTFIEYLEKETGNKVIDSIVKAEPIGPKNMVDIILVAPCTGNTLAKFANGIMESPVLLSVKSHLRNLKPVVIAISTNDGLGLSFENLGKLYNTKNIYLVPFTQDDYIKKPNSLVFKKEKVIDTIEKALEGKQIQPIIKEK